MGTANSNGTSKRNVRPSPGPEVEIIDSNENGPPAQYANSNATKDASPMRRRFFVGAYSPVGPDTELIQSFSLLVQISTQGVLYKLRVEIADIHTSQPHESTQDYQER